ncbi:MAG: hypothetical protein Rubg2KO_12450 [Rubricoccaceae bacterium]
MTGTLLGYDPGGNGHHGLAILSVEAGQPRAITIETCATVEDVLRRLEPIPDLIGAGIDTITCWSSGPSGWRPADRWMRQQYPTDVARSVTSPNSLYGSMSLSGMSVIHTLRQLDPSLPITETHPKVIHAVLWGHRYDYAHSARQMDLELASILDLDVRTANDHEWDAVVASFSMLSALRGDWLYDLHQLEPDPDERILMPCGPTLYAWPEGPVLAKRCSQTQ